MAGLLTKARLKTLLLNLGNYLTEADVIDAWSDAWEEFFSVASAQSSNAVPSYVTDETTTLKIGVNSLLGTGDNSGTNVVVTFNATGYSRNLVSQYDTANFIRTTGLLGQFLPSTILNDYDIRLPGMVIEVSALSTAKNLFKDALNGITGTNAAAGKLAKALEVWWDDLQANPSTYFSGASAIIPPTGLITLQVDLQDVFDENSEVIENLGTITSDQALDAVAQALIDGNTGGILEKPGSPNPQQYTIE